MLKNEYISWLHFKHSLNHENQIIFLMILKREGLYYLAVKKLSALLRGSKSKSNDYFYCLNCLCSIRTKNKLESNKEVCEK